MMDSQPAVADCSPRWGALAGVLIAVQSVEHEQFAS